MAILVFVIIWLVGVAGTFIPVLPATLIIFAGALVAAFIEGFEGLSWPWLVGLGVLAVFVSLIDNIAGSWGARRWGGSKQATWGALIGGLVGIFIPFGLLVGPLAGALIAELLFAKRDFPTALRSTWGTLVGLLTGIAAKFVLHILMGVVVIWRLAAA